MIKKIQCYVPDWAEMESLAASLERQLRVGGFQPDLIVAVARGGLVPARLLADFLRLKDILSVKTDHWGITAQKDGKARITHGLNADLSGRHTLVIDDVTDTGESMKLTAEHVEQNKPRKIKTAALYHFKTSKFRPDYIGQERDWAWIVFPWNRREDLVNFIKQLQGEGVKEADDLQAGLKEHFTLDVPATEIVDILENAM